MNRIRSTHAGMSLLAFFAFVVLIGRAAGAPSGAFDNYMPLTMRTLHGSPATATPTPPTPGPGTPTSTPTATPTQPPAGAEGSLYITTAVETASGSAQVDANGGMHAAFVHFTSSPDPSPAAYSVCTAGGVACDNPANWTTVLLGNGAREVQLRLTADGKPRMLIVTHSTVYTTGKDYYYAECNSGCTSAANWTLTRITSTDGTSIFDINDQYAPQRSFALDPQGRPAFIFQDRNYFIEPDRYGAFYAHCASNCASAASWTLTNIARVFPYDYEVFRYPSLTFTSSGQPRLVAGLFALNDDGSDAPEGLYYYACDAGCDTMSNWQRTFLFYPGSGSFPLPAWDMEVDANGNPHVVFFTGGGAEAGIDYQLVYITCTSNCLGDNSWSGTVLGLPANDGQGPDIELDAAGRPRVAFMYNYDDLGYAWCDSNCAAADTSWQTVVVDTPEEQEADNPQALPPYCDQDLWQGLTPTLALDAAGNPRIAHDVTVDARCTYEDPDDPNNPIIRYERVWNGVRWNFLPKP